MANINPSFRMSVIINMKYLLVTIFLFSLCSLSTVEGQRGFKGSILAGLNLSQIDGDELVGYRQAGLTSGLKVSFQLKNRLYGNLELLYSQRGSSAKLFSNNGSVTRINYLELPLYVSFKDWYIENENYYKLSGEVGLSLGNIISASVSEEVTDYNPDWFETKDIGWMLGANYAFTKHLSVTVRYTRSINKLLDDNTLFERYLLGYFWTIRTDYTF